MHPHFPRERFVDAGSILQPWLSVLMQQLAAFAAIRSVP